MIQSGNEKSLTQSSDRGPGLQRPDDKNGQGARYPSDPGFSVKPALSVQRQGKTLDPAITDELISELVDEFYDRIRQHPRLATLFAGGMSLDWPEHLDIMKAFWRSMLMQTREYNGRPVPVHKKMQDLTPQDFADWLALFRQTAEECCPSSAASLFVDRAQTIARNLQMALFFSGQVLPKNAFEEGVLKKDFQNELDH